MTVKELIKKMDSYNEIARLVDAPEMEIRFKDGIFSSTVKDSKSFAKFVRETYIKCVADDILNGDYEFGKGTVITSGDGHNTFTRTVEFDISARW